MLLARTATANAKPELEIFADDVKCAHGATVGELDAMALFYLESRGIPTADAKKLLLRAFVGSVFDDIADEGERTRVEAAAQVALERMLESPYRLREGLGEGVSHG
jgi:Fe-S cluster assembly protein SufD